MRTGFIPKTPVKILLIGLLSFSVPPRVSVAQSSPVKLSFSMLTASHAALGAPMTYQLVLTNTSRATIQIGANVKLIDPNGASFTLLSTEYTLERDQVEVASAAFETSSFTSATGAFTLRGFITDALSGDILVGQDLSLTVVPVPDNFVYASIGGQGPVSARLGYTTDYQTVVANLGTSSKSLKTNTTLIKTDGTEIVLSKRSARVLSPGESVTTPGSVTTSQYSTIAGVYSVRVDVLESGGNDIVATDTFSFSRTALSARMYPPSFTDTATQAGVNQPRTVVRIPDCGKGLPDVMDGGAGAAAADYDGDGFEDLYVVDMSGLGHLWHNEGDGTFTDKAAASGIPILVRQSGASFADIDNDGYSDLLLLPAEAQLMLLRNRGDGTFDDITSTAGLRTPIDQNFVGATWGDYDNDGFLDAYVAVHADCAGINTNDHLFHNNGNLTFSDVTNLLGGPGGPQVNARSLVPVFVDYNGDGWIDLYVGNDVGGRFYPNVLWRNDGPGGPNGWIFTDVSAETGTNVQMSAMGIGIGDYNRQGVFNFLVTNVKDNVLLQEQSDGTFVQVQGNGVGGAHVARPTIPNPNGSGHPVRAVTWNTAFYDFNNDGWEDIYLSGGPIFDESVNPNALLLNNRDGTFLDLSLLSGTTDATGSMPGTVFADFNNDGFMDIFQSGADHGSPHLYMDNGRAQGNPNHWLEVKLIGTVSNRDAVGARLIATVGGAKLRRWVINTGFQGNSTLIQHFGLGGATQVDKLAIRWPSGITRILKNVQADQRIVVTE
jgi:hypothetical protein